MARSSGGNRKALAPHRCMGAGCRRKATFITYWPEVALVCDRPEIVVVGDRERRSPCTFGPYVIPLDQFFRECARGGWTPIDHVRESKRHGEECAAILEAFLRGVPLPPPHRPWWESPRRL